MAACVFCNALRNRTVFNVAGETPGALVAEKRPLILGRPRRCCHGNRKIRKSGVRGGRVLSQEPSLGMGNERGARASGILQSEVLRSVAGCPSVRPTLEGMGVEFVEESTGAAGVNHPRSRKRGATRTNV